MVILLEHDMIKGSSIRNAPDVMVRSLHCILKLRHISAREPGRTITDGNDCHLVIRSATRVLRHTRHYHSYQGDLNIYRF